jgi:hypothetical protein
MLERRFPPPWFIEDIGGCVARPIYALAYGGLRASEWIFINTTVSDGVAALDFLLSIFLRCLFKGAHHVLSRDHALQLTVSARHREAAGLETHHQLKNSR